MAMEITRRRRRPWWMTPYGREPMGDVWSDRLWPEWPRGWGEEYGSAYDFYEKDGNYVVKAELPGVNKDDISVTMEDDVITISGKKETKREDEGDNYFVRESSSGSFSRSFRLPSAVDAEKVDATFKDGVLTVTMKPTGEAKGNKVEIK
jgi:HSP20 family protein